MARIAGIDLPRNKRIDIALTYIYGIGRTSAAKRVEEAGVDMIGVGDAAGRRLGHGSGPVLGFGQYAIDNLQSQMSVRTTSGVF